jgi:hypothetical protein
MDTYKDAVLLNDLWASGEAPWRVWGREQAGARSAPVGHPGDELAAEGAAR